MIILKLVINKKKDDGMKPIIKWSQYDIINQEATYRQKELKRTNQPIVPIEILYQQIADEPWFLSDSWNEMLKQLSDFMERKNPSRKWLCKVKNFGWRKIDGHKEFECDSGQEFLRNILPDTDCTFNIYHFKMKGFKIQNFHHDSPTGNEWYYIVPLHLRKNLEVV